MSPGAWLILFGACGIFWWSIVRGLISVVLTALIRRNGMPAVGTVGPTRLRKIEYAEPVPGTWGTGRIYNFRVTYHTEGLVSFTTADGKVIEFWVDLDGNDIPKPTLGPFDLRYLTKYPHLHRFTKPRFVSAWFYVFLGLVIGGSTLGFGIWVLHQPS